MFILHSMLVALSANDSRKHIFRLLKLREQWRQRKGASDKLGDRSLVVDAFFSCFGLKFVMKFQGMILSQTLIDFARVRSFKFIFPWSKCKLLLLEILSNFIHCWASSLHRAVRARSSFILLSHNLQHTNFIQQELPGMRRLWKFGDKTESVDDTTRSTVWRIELGKVREKLETLFLNRIFCLNWNKMRLCFEITRWNTLMEQLAGCLKFRSN